MGEMNKNEHAKTGDEILSEDINLLEEAVYIAEQYHGYIENNWGVDLTYLEDRFAALKKRMESKES